MAETQKTVEVNGKDYTLQKITPREWARLRDRCKNRYGTISEEQFMSEIMKHIVVEPKVTLDDFTDWADTQEVVNEAVRFQLGRAAEE